MFQCACQVLKPYNILNEKIFNFVGRFIDLVIFQNPKVV